MAAASGAACITSAPTAQAKPTASVKIIDTHLPNARKLAVGPRSQIYVLAGRSINTYLASGLPVRSVPLKRAPRCLAVLPGGDVLVGMRDQIERIQPNGRVVVAKWDRLGKQTLLSDLAIDGDEVFAADAGRGVVWRYSTSGKLLGQITPQGGAITAPADFFSVAASGRMVHMTNPKRHRVETYHGDGRYVGVWGANTRDEQGFSGCCNPVAFAQTKSGQFITAERGQPRIKQFSSSGELQNLLAGPEQFAENAKATADDNGLGCNSGGFDLTLTLAQEPMLLDRVTGRITIYS